MGGPAASARRAAEGGAASLTPRRHRGHRRARTRHTSNTHSGARSAESDTRGAVRWRPRLLAENTTRAQLRALHAQSPVRTPQRLGPRVCVAGARLRTFPSPSFAHRAPGAGAAFSGCPASADSPRGPSCLELSAASCGRCPVPTEAKAVRPCSGGCGPQPAKDCAPGLPAPTPQVLVCMVGRRGQALRLLSSQIPLLPRLP